jgi:hypothetical protein
MVIDAVLFLMQNSVISVRRFLGFVYSHTGTDRLAISYTATVIDYQNSKACKKTRTFWHCKESFTWAPGITPREILQSPFLP